MTVRACASVYARVKDYLSHSRARARPHTRTVCLLALQREHGGEADRMDVGQPQCARERDGANL